ncbi:MAG TPA: glycosyltransferase family 39 protein [Candidatus Saccharimonadales bacterium]|nr:glycosyltransferase family 39 protein [Candidatus Saccharimonadales bacterium]
MPEGTRARDGVRQTLLPVLVIFALALAVRILFIATISTTGCLAINRDPVSDMDAFHEWASGIAGGDWLCRNDFHPFHPWQSGIAPEATWLEWYGPHVFHQDPLYPYFVAAIYSVAPRAPLSVVLVQLLLGAATASGIFLLARRLVSPVAALAAGILAALYGPFLFYESLLLRAALLVFLTTAFLLCLEEARRRRGVAWWLGAGLVAGAVYLTKPTIVVFLPLLAGWILVSREAARPGRAVAALAAGFALSVSPAIARNLAVGAPALKTTTRGAIEFINGNSPYHPGTGWFDGDDARVTAYARGILSRTRSRLLPTVAEVLRTWRTDPAGFAWLQIRKLGYLFAPFEMPNNASYAYFRLNSWPLRSGLPTFYVLAPFSLLGLIVTLPSWRRLAPHYLFLASGIAVTVAFYVIARFRAPFLPLAIVFAGAGTGFLVHRAITRDWARLAAACALVIAALAVATAFNEPDRQLVRPEDYYISGLDYSARGHPALGAEELEKGIAIFPGALALRVEAAKAWERAGETRRAIEQYQEALKADPGSDWLAEQIRRLQAAGGGTP